MEFANTNLAVIAVCMVLNRHVKPEVRFVRGGHSLLVSPNTNTYYQCSHVNALDPTREGAYLYYDPNMDYFVRSGKVTRSGFIDRHQQHFKESGVTNQVEFSSGQLWDDKRHVSKSPAGCSSWLDSCVGLE